METLRESIVQSDVVPYIYNYPPTRLYRRSEAPMVADIETTSCVNLYIHIPFCEQKCTFCGYLTVIDTSDALRARYVEAVCQELRLYAPLLSSRTISSINFGGGTPSLLSGEELAVIISTIESINPSALRTASEVSIEATPETVTLEKFRAYHACGINRVSIGIQSFDDAEILSVKRHNLRSASSSALAVLRDIGFPNVCADLMYGLPGQDSASFARSVDALIAARPETVELYGTVIIPGTALAHKGVALAPREKIRAYETARERFLAAGYSQECHLRFALSGKGGYRQQENVYALETLIGVGVGARSYAKRVHYRNVYDTAHSRDALRQYIDRTARGIIPVESKVVLSDDELMRRYAIHRLERLDCLDFQRQFGCDAKDVFPVLKRLLEEGMLCDKSGTLVLEPNFLAYRDRIAREFFSPQALSGEAMYYTNDLVPLRRPR